MKLYHFFLALAAALLFLLGAFTAGPFLEKINRQDAATAAKVVGLDFTTAEIDSLLPTLGEYRESYQDIRQQNIPNALSPALQLNPLPANFQIPTGPDGIHIDLPETKLPANRAELAFYTVRQLAALLRSRQITSLELTEFFLARLKKYDPTLHCVITLTEDLAKEQARQADAEIAAGKFRSLVHGIPYGAKDLLATKNYKTTWGATPYQDQMIDENAVVIEKLADAGAVLVAKLTLGALAWGDVWFGGMTRNPWNPETGSSGSSAGSASAVAGGLVPFAIGTETLGSIVSPSTVCGTTGLRPTYGRVSRKGAMALSWSMDKIGPLTRSAEDALIVLDIIRGTDGHDIRQDIPLDYRSLDATNRKLRIGYLAKDFARNYPFKAQDSLALLALRQLGYELVPLELPKMPPIGFILEAEAAAAFDQLTLTNQDDELVRQIKNAWPNVFRAARYIPAVEYIQANRLRTQLIEDMEVALSDVDLYVHPSWASQSLRITNFTGHPCLVLPNGFRENGLPTSITLTGQLYEEGKLVAVGQAFQDATNWDEQHPELQP
ncbi:MAG: amidase [Bacteroidota bacterium]